MPPHFGQRVMCLQYGFIGSLRMEGGRLKRLLRSRFRIVRAERNHGEVFCSVGSRLDCILDIGCHHVSQDLQCKFGMVVSWDSPFGGSSGEIFADALNLFHCKRLG